MQAIQFQRLILKWFDQHGRHHLPWQQNKTPYRVWISEIMLQQTQVATVIPYFERFIQHFPNLAALAKASEDQVLHLWTGLGYYSRARNLHRAAKMIIDQFAERFPDQLTELITLPGIGQSTAGAILALAFNQRATILDGNVKRVLSRFLGITDPINDKKIENQLWLAAEKYTPQKRVADYTQAMMDLGATICVRGKPNCALCPLASSCQAKRLGIAQGLPNKKPSKALPIKTATFIILKNSDQTLLLEKRNATGIWGGLWSFPELTGKPNKKAIQSLCARWSIKVRDFQTLPAFRHTFTHYHLDIFPILIELKTPLSKLIVSAKQIWYNLELPAAIGLPKPVQMIMRNLK